MISKHPWWYYIYYNQIFSRNINDYSHEIDLLAEKMEGFHNKKVIEIGSGLGGHSSKILEHKPSNLTLADIDPIAFHILSRKFLEFNEVAVVQEDGFKIDADLKFYDRIVCMNSLVQQCSTKEDLLSRIASLYNIATENSFIAFEMIDIEISKYIHPSTQENTIYSNDKDIIKIKSEYIEDNCKIRFWGYLNNQECSYQVDLINIETKVLQNILEEDLFSSCTYYPLEQNERRVIFICKK